MERMNFVMFCLGASSLAIGLVVMPYVSMLRNAFKSRIKRGKNTQPNNVFTIEDKIMIGKILNRIDEQEKTINNLAERLSTREKNRKNNTRRDVRDYLAELRDEK